jgi:hypothetical protein
VTSVEVRTQAEAEVPKDGLGEPASTTLMAMRIDGLAAANLRRTR